MIEITRRAEFCASHRLHNPELSDEENRRIYGCCNNKHGHGHNYTLEVTVRGTPDARTGMVMNLLELGDIIQQQVVAKLDHRHLNEDVDFMRGKIPTAENLAIEIWKVLEPQLGASALHEVRLYETKDNFVVYKGE